MEKHLQFKEGINLYKGIEFELKIKKIKSFIIKINKENKIVVSIPLKANKIYLIKFLDSNLEKFEQLRIENLFKKSINIDEKWFYLFGNKIFFTIDELEKNILIEGKKYSLLNKSINKAINQYRKKHLSNYLNIRQSYFEKIMNIEPHSIGVRDKEGAWATNHVLKRKIYYSINLSSFSEEIIDYVIVHELVHNKFPNHSKEFWNNVLKYEKDFKIKRRKLKKLIYN